MSTTVDTNVVQLKFDNKQFEEGCRQSMSTLEKLNQQIDNTSSGKAFKEIGKAANEIDLSKLGASVDALNKRFSVLGIAGMTAINEITKSVLNLSKNLLTAIPNKIKNGGWTRAMNIENAKFQLEGLGIAWSKVGEQISNAVNGTAYGMDSAAKAASQLAAAGVDIGNKFKKAFDYDTTGRMIDEMEMALSAISGIAAQTNSNYDDIARVFMQISATGRLMAQDMNQIAARGVNVAATLAKQLGKTQVEVREMISKGQIDFKTFSEAMYDAFAENAFKANNTFKGAFDNMLAALSRIGERFAGPIIRQIIPVFNALREAINGVNDQLGIFSSNNVADISAAKDILDQRKAELEEIEEAFKSGAITVSEYDKKVKESRKAVEEAGKAYMDTLGPFERLLIRIREKVVDLIPKRDSTFWKFIQPLGRAIANIGHDIMTVFSAIGSAWFQIFGRHSEKNLLNFAEGFEKLTESLRLSDKEAAYLNLTFQGLFSIMDLIFSTIADLLGAIMGVSTGAATLREKILFVTSVLGFAIRELTQFIKSLHLAREAVEIVKTALGAIVYAFIYVGKEVSNVVERFNQLDSSVGVFDRLKYAIGPVISKISDFVAKAKEFVFNFNPEFFNNLQKSISKLSIPQGFKDALSWLVDRVEDLKNGIAFVVGLAIEGFKALTTTISNFFGGGKNKDVITKTTTVVEPVQRFGQAVTEVGTEVDLTGNKLTRFGSAISGFIKNINWGTVAALGFASAIVVIALKLASAIKTYSNAVKAATSVMKTMSKHGIMGLIFGVNEKRPPSMIAQVAGSVLLLASAFGVLAYASQKVDLKEAEKAMIGIGVGLTVVLGVLTAFQKILGKTIKLNEITMSVVELASAVTLLAAGLKLISTIPVDNLWEYLHAFEELILTITLMQMAISAFGTVLAYFQEPLAIGGMSILGMAASVLVLAKGLEVLSKADLSGITKDKLMPLVGVATVMILLGGLAAKLNSKSLLGLVASLVVLKVAFPILKTLATDIASWWSTLSTLQKGLLTTIAIVASIVAIIAILDKASRNDLPKAATTAEKTKKSFTKIGDAFKTLSSALKNLTIIPLIITATAAVVALGGLMVAIGKLADWGDIARGLVAIGALATIMGVLLKVAAKCKGASFGPIFAVTIALGSLVAELAILSLMISTDLGGTLMAFVVLAAVITSLGGLMFAINKMSFDEYHLVALGEMIIILIGIAGTMAKLSGIPWQRMVAPIIAIGAVLGELILSFKMINDVTVYPEQLVLVALGIAELIAIGQSLKALAKFKADSIMAALVAMSGTMLSLAGCLVIMNQIRYNASTGLAVVSAVALCVTIGLSLSNVAQYDWKSISHTTDAMLSVMWSLVGILGVLAAIQAIPYIGEALDIVMILLPIAGLSILEFGQAIGTAASGLAAFGAVMPVVASAIASLQDIDPVALLAIAVQLPILAIGLGAIGAAGAVASLGVSGLTGVANALPKLTIALGALSKIELKGLIENVLKFTAVAAGMAILSPIFMLASAACTTFGASLLNLSAGVASAAYVLAQAVPAFFNVGANIIQGLVNGISSIAMAPINLVKDIGSDILDGFRDVLGIHSPSTETYPIGGFLYEGLMNGMEDTFPELQQLYTSEMSTMLSDMGSYDSDFYNVGAMLGNSYGQGLSTEVTRAATSVMAAMETALAQADPNYAYHGPGSDTDKVAGEGSDSNSSFLDGFDDAISSLDDFSAASGKAGGSSSKLKDEVTKLGDAFKAFSEKADTSARTMMLNMYSNIAGTVKWAQGVQMLQARGMSETMINYLKDAGTSSYGMVKSLLKMTNEQLAQFNAGIPAYLTVSKTTENMLKGKYEDLGNTMVGAIASAFANFDAEFAENTQNAIDPFSEFDKSSETSKNQLLSNMQSQIDGVTDWANKLGELAKRGIDDGLLQKLKDMGPSGYQYVAAFASMTNDELAHANELWTQTMMLGEQAGLILAQSYNEAGNYITQGFQEGVDMNVASNTMTQFGSTGLAAFNGVFAIHSPSQVMHDNGGYIMQGLVNGINKSTPKARNTFRLTAKSLLETFKEILSGDHAKEIGIQMMDGLEAGIWSGASSVISAAATVAANALKAAKDALGIHSPSREFMKIGMYSDMGMAKGFDMYSGLVTDSISKLGDDTIQMMQDVIQQLSYNLDHEMDMSPVIRPRLDLTEIQNRKNQLNGLFGDNTVALAHGISNGISGAHNVNPVTSKPNQQTIINNTFNQINNSPKSLDAYEVYRQTRNLLSMAGGTK